MFPAVLQNKKKRAKIRQKKPAVFPTSSLRGIHSVPPTRSTRRHVTRLSGFMFILGSNYRVSVNASLRRAVNAGLYFDTPSSPPYFSPLLEARHSCPPPCCFVCVSFPTLFGVSRLPDRWRLQADPSLIWRDFTCRFALFFLRPRTRIRFTFDTARPPSMCRAALAFPSRARVYVYESAAAGFA